MYVGLHVKYRYSCQISENWIVWADFRKIFKYEISWKSLQWEPSCSMSTDGRTDRQPYKHDNANSYYLPLCERA